MLFSLIVNRFFILIVVLINILLLIDEFTSPPTADRDDVAFFDVLFARRKMLRLYWSSPQTPLPRRGAFKMLSLERGVIIFISISF